MSRVNNDSHMVTHGWMINELKLKGNELTIYACIYGFTQNKAGEFSGSLQYLADWCNSTKESARLCVNSLVSKGLLIKEDLYINEVKFCKYRAVRPSPNFNEGIQESCMGYPTQLDGGIQNSCTNNINNNINNNIVYTQKKLFNTSKDRDSMEIFEEYKIIRKHKQYTQRFSKAILDALNKYSKENIILAIHHYREVLDKSEYFTTVWDIDEFMKKDNALPDFLDDGKKWVAFQNEQKKSKGTKSFQLNNVDDYNTPRRRDV